MGLRSSATRIAGIALAMTLLLVASLVAGAGAKPFSGSAERVGTVCAKKANKAATAAKRRQLRQHCIKEMKRTASRRSTDVTPPTVAWKAPSTGATVKGKLGGSTCEALAGDDRGVKRVVMKVDGTVLNTESDAPWNCNFDSTRVADGSHTLTATAYDAAGNSRAAAVTVNVANTVAPKPAPEPSPAPEPAPAPAPEPEPEPTPAPAPEPAPADAAPTVKWATPVAGSNVTRIISGSTCEALASDDKGIVKVVMKVDGTVLNTESDAPWNCNFDSTRVADGSHTLTATAYDAAGNSRAAAVTVNVANTVAPKPAPEPSPAPEPAPAPAPEPEPEPTPAPAPEPAPADAAPTVKWATPVAGSNVTRIISGSTCEALASDDKGIVKVVMKVDGTVLNTESDAPWNCNFDSTKVADGTHVLSATAYDTAGHTTTASISVNVSNLVDPAPEPTPAPEPEPAPPPSPTPGTFPGSGLTIAVDGGHGYWSDAEIGYRAQLGAAVTRHEWDPTEPVDHQDEIVYAAAAQIHTRIHAQLGANELGSASSYREFVIAFIKRYGLGGTFWKLHPELNEAAYAITTVELGNEPYFGEMSASLYADTVRPTLEAIKSQKLPVKVILVSRVYGTDTSWMDTLYARIPNLNEYFYAFADHPYWYGHDPSEGTAAGPFGRIEVLRKRMNEKGASSKPIWITEYGQSTANCGSQCVSEATQKEHLQKILNAAINRSEWKIGLISVFQLRDRGTNSTDREYGFGLLRYDGSQKPCYSMVRSLMQQYRG